ncbi:hypothetical protein L1987_48219 [Smallanthus sonchifolius]|uniref:Uncharacterized protein n=1 Tax=Smallanthus sonchifolius TaxID=185202 RepID=A0ACB9FRC3_9ASTR|nr:hypothetical protein L1987_48219 [Smallanthus sonchifolius]
MMQRNTEIDHRVNEYALGIRNNYAKTLVASGNLDDAYKNIVTKIDAAKAKFNNLKQMRSELTSERHKVKQSLEELKCRIENYEPKLRDMPSQALQEEVQALMSDKSGETEYQESMQSQIDTVKEISHTVKCGCGDEYKVEVDLCV